LPTSSYNDRQINLIENTPEEIKDVVIEMIEYLNLEKGNNITDDLIPKHFWNLYSQLCQSTEAGKMLDGQLKSRFSYSYLKNNQKWGN
jgi:hypothetical protein